MDPVTPPDAAVRSWLSTLGVASLCQWDTLIFLYRHQTSLFGADYLALLMGYATDRLLAALDVLESLGLVERSRVSQGARLYRFTVPSEPPRAEAFGRLLDLAGHRPGRLLLSRQLQRGDRTPEEGLRAAQRFLEEANQACRAIRQRKPPRKVERKTWRKAI